LIYLNKVDILSEKFPVLDHYPFNMKLFQDTEAVSFNTPITFFMGENGTGKSTLLKALAYSCGIHIWQSEFSLRYEPNPYENDLYKALSIEWEDGPVTGSFFGSQIFSHFAKNLEEWAVNDAAMLKYFGGKSLITQSHGQSLMSYFSSRYTLKGLYFLDEPETALSPKSQLALLRILNAMGNAGHAQFIVATHSPILLACPGAVIYTFDQIPLCATAYEETDYYQIYRNFMQDRAVFLDCTGD